MLQIDGEKIVLREFTKTELYDEKYFLWLRDLEIITQIYHLDYFLPLDFSEVVEYVQSLWDSKSDCFFAIYYKENNKFIGTQRIGHINWRTGIADMGIMIGDEEYRGKGLSKDIMRTSMKYAFKNLSLRKLTGGTSRTNIAMQKCFEGLGFVKEGVIRSQLLIDGEYIDHILYGILKSEYKIN
ncbi:MAG: GNAT family N-acetyltransferase [Bacteroidales bacterium]|nr:GNAT family N-acetyltransferase [Bacteroidales bacterium]